MKKEFKCYFCKEILQNNEIVLHKVGKNNYKFHNNKSCYDEFIKRKKEKDDRKMCKEDIEEWNLLYKYVKKEILGLSDEKILSNHVIKRLQGLRMGKYSVHRNDVLKHGKSYSYKVILLTFKLCKVKVLRAISNKTFESEQHKFDYIMAIITNQINEVDKKYKHKERESFQTLELDIKSSKNEIFEKTNIKQDKIANLLEDIF